MQPLAMFWTIVILPLNGCALESLIFGDSDVLPADLPLATYDYSAYSRSFDNEWIGRSRDDLVDALGPPDFIYEARPKFTEYWEAGIPAYTYVYAGGGSPARCVDAYVVDQPTGTVIKYYCR